jgi:hypothetical protein
MFGAGISLATAVSYNRQADSVLEWLAALGDARLINTKPEYPLCLLLL